MVEVVRRNAVLADGCFPVDQALVHHIHGNPNGGETGALAVSGLEHPEFVILDSELNVLNIFVVRFEGAPDFIELGINLGHFQLELGDFLGVRMPATTSSP